MFSKPIQTPRSRSVGFAPLSYNKLNPPQQVKVIAIAWQEVSSSHLIRGSPVYFHFHFQEAHAYPGPMAELNFWSERAANLNSIHEQLSGEKIQKVVKILELAKSAYFPAFERLFSEVEHARTEANDNVKVGHKGYRLPLNLA